MDGFRHKLMVRYSIVHEFFGTLWKYKLWWGFPVIFILFVLMIMLFIAGHSGVAAFIYPLF